ncbi:MAG: redoxin family protein [Lachnospiraceae bacterium]|nr:redoxin family protein [Lachnospiraceae bacterium]
MAEIRKWWGEHKPTTRRLVQLYAALLYNANLKGFAEGKIYTGRTKAMCVPGFNCYSCPGAVGACPLGSIQNALASSGHTAGWYVLGIILLYGVLLGRTICGWLCPLGLIQELLHKIPTPKIRKNAFTRVLSYLKYVILVIFVIAFPLWYGLKYEVPLPGFCKYICPAGTFEGAIGMLGSPNNTDLFSQLGILFTRKFTIMLVIGLACVFCYRSFCRFICPLGAIYGLFNRFALAGVKVDPIRCNHCGNCVRNCGMDVRRVGDHECISCGKCMESCAQGAISIKCGSITLKGPESGKNADPEDVRARRRRNGRIAWGVLLAVLAGAVIYFNFIDVPQKTQAQSAAAEAAVSDGGEQNAPAAPAVSAAEQTAAAVSTAEQAAGTVSDAEKAAVSESGAESAQAAQTSSGTSAEESGKDEKAAPAEDFTSQAPIGYEVGQQLADFSCEISDGSTFHLADYRGKVVFINVWATYCMPCVKELPYFEELKKAHPEIEILAVHNSIEASPKMLDYIADKGWDHLKFTLEKPERPVMTILNASDVMPQTVVLNKKGEVIYNERKSMTLDMLESLYKKAGGE